MALTQAERAKQYRDRLKQEGITEAEDKKFKQESKKDKSRVSDVLANEQQALAEKLRAEGMRKRAESLQSPFAKRLEK